MRHQQQTNCWNNKQNCHNLYLQSFRFPCFRHSTTFLRTQILLFFLQIRSHLTLMLLCFVFIFVFLFYYSTLTHELVGECQSTMNERRDRKSTAANKTKSELKIICLKTMNWTFSVEYVDAFDYYALAQSVLVHPKYTKCTINIYSKENEKENRQEMPNENSKCQRNKKKNKKKSTKIQRTSQLHKHAEWAVCTRFPTSIPLFLSFFHSFLLFLLFFYPKKHCGFSTHLIVSKWLFCLCAVAVASCAFCLLFCCLSNLVSLGSTQPQH